MRLRDIRETAKAVPELIDSATVAGDRVTLAAERLRSAVELAIIAMAAIAAVAIAALCVALAARDA